MKRHSSPNWLSLHVFLSDPVQTERYLRERLHPAIQRWRADRLLDRWFFIRYWEGGPHLRVRLAGPIAENEAHATAVLSDRIAEFCSDVPPTRDEYYRGHTFDGQPVVVDDLPWYAEGTVANIGYQSEIIRYGGEAAVGASEQLFELSSQLALGVCKANQGNQNGVLSSAFGLMAAAVLACGEDLRGLGAYFEQYGAVWASISGRDMREGAPSEASDGQMTLLLRLQQEAAAGWQGKSAHGVWAAGVRELIGHLKSLHEQGTLVLPFDRRPTVGDDMYKGAVFGVVGSQIHMLNNRLGVPPAGEVLLARLLVGAANALSQRDTKA